MMPSPMRVDPVVGIADMAAGDTAISAILGPSCPVPLCMPYGERVDRRLCNGRLLQCCRTPKAENL